jgi:hypothetical protein
MKTKLLAFASVLSLGLVMGVSSASAAGGISCQKQIEICTKQIGAIQSVLNAVDAICTASGQDACLAGVARLQARLAATQIACGDKIDAACL